MPRRFEIELTSRTGDGAFTWRVVGAKQPRGIVTDDLVPSGAAVGDVLRAELEQGIEGFEVVTAQSKDDKPVDGPTNRIEVIGTPQRGADVNVIYAPGARRRRDDGDGPGRSDRGPRPERSGRRDARRPGGSAPGGSAPGGERPRGPRAERDQSSPREGADAVASGETGSEHNGDRPERTERGGPRPERRGPTRPDGRDSRGGPPQRDRERDRGPKVSTTHRNAMLGTLGPQELPIAEQLLRGGIPAVRQAIAEQIANQRGGAAAVNSDAVLAIAEQLLPKVNLATWKDRATSAQAAGRDLRLRELRAVVTSSRTVTLDDEGRVLSKALHEALDQRAKALRDEWMARLTKALDEGRVAEAIAVSVRTPEPGTRLPAEVAVRLAESAGAAMTAETDPAEWLSILEAVLESAVRRTVKPQGIPPVPETQEAARRAAGSVPALAKLLGLRIPPPPPPPRRPVAGRPIPVGGAARGVGH